MTSAVMPRGSLPMSKPISSNAARMNSAIETIVLAAPIRNFIATTAMTMSTIKIISDVSDMCGSSDSNYLIVSKTFLKPISSISKYEADARSCKKQHRRQDS